MSTGKRSLVVSVKRFSIVRHALIFTRDFQDEINVAPSQSSRKVDYLKFEVFDADYFPMARRSKLWVICWTRSSGPWGRDQ